MKRLRILPLTGPVKSETTVPGSKSYTNRALLIAALTPGTVHITNPLVSDDTEAMMSCLKKLGISLSSKNGAVEVAGDIGQVKARDYTLDTQLSGITTRFLLALCCVIPGRQTIHGGPGLNARPIGDISGRVRLLGLSERGHPRR